MGNSKSALLKKIQNSNRLPILPQILLKLIYGCNDETASIADISDIISKDPTLCTKVMQLVNSPHMGLASKADSIEKAADHLDLDNIITLAISASVMQTFGTVSKISANRLNRFWWHSLMCAFVSKRIASAISYDSPNEAFLAGFLHDIGKLLLWENVEEDYMEIENTLMPDTDRLQMEESKFDFNHCAAGSWLVKQWHIKSFLADAVLYHHENPEKIVSAFPLVKIVYYANLLCHMPTDDDQFNMNIAHLLFNLNPSQMEDVISQAKKETTDVARSFGIQIELFSDPVAPPINPEASLVSNDISINHQDEKLLEEIKNNSLLYSTLQNLLKADGRDAILRLVENSLQKLFSAKKILLFSYETENELLVGYSPGGDGFNEMIHGLVIPPTNHTSIIVKSLSENTITDSFGILTSKARNLADRQIIGLLETEGILCLPLYAYEIKIGVIVVGIEAFKAQQVCEQLASLNFYVNHIAICLHVDNLKQQKAKWIQSERVEASSLIARNVVHEVNNPLGIIKNYLKILGLKLPEKHAAQDDLIIINEEIERVVQIVHQLADFSEPRIRRKETFDINNFITDLTKVIRTSLLTPFDIEVHLNLDFSLPYVDTEKDSLKQVFINLIKNSVEAMPSGGNIYIETKHLHKSDKIVGDSKKLSQGIEISFKDDGPGIGKKIKQHLFEPYNSSKGKGHSGLGLSIIHNIIKELRGTIICPDHIDKGTLFIITLPVATPQL